MKLVLAITLLCCLAAPALAKNLGSIQVKDYGEVWVVAPDWAVGAIQVGCLRVRCDNHPVHAADA